MTIQYDEQQLEQMRGKVAEILEHAKSDSAYLSQLRADPERTLSAAGLPDAAVNHLIGESDLAADVVGYNFSPIGDVCEMTCDTITCLVTRCVNMPYTGTR